MSTNHSTRPAPSASSPNPTEEMNANPNPRAAGAVAALPHVYGVHTQGLVEPAPMPIYLGAQNTPTTEGHPHPAAYDRHHATSSSSSSTSTSSGEPHPASHLEPEGGPLPAYRGPSQAYDPAALLRHLLTLLALLLGLTLWLGGWQPHTSDARLGWSHGTIDVIEGTDGDTGARPLPPNDNGGFRLDGSAGRPVEMGKTFFGDTSRLAPSTAPWSGPAEA